jgi:two-component system, chemotaxis family, response regulator PixG
LAALKAVKQQVIYGDSLGFHQAVTEAKIFMMTAEATLFQSLRQPKFTGQVIYQQAAERGSPWVFDFYMGRVLYGHGGTHSMRRWLRHLAVACPQLFPNINVELANALQSPDCPTFSIHWQYQILTYWINQRRITREQVRQIIVGLTQEILFDILQANAFMAYTQVSSSLPVQLVPLNIEDCIAESERELRMWSASGLQGTSPNLAPVICQAEALQSAAGNVYRVLSKLLDGQRTLRDLAFKMKRDLLSVTRSLIPYVEKGYLALNTVADLPEPNVSTALAGRVSGGTLSASPPVSARPLIACIDDSPIICQGMERVITDAQYRFIGISDPLRSIAQLLAQKPDLIFLVLVMPNANGYEICGQLRKLSLFKETPIVILTGQDGILDRVRAKLVGATDFISKPVTGAVVLETIARHLSLEISSPDPPR